MREWTLKYTDISSEEYDKLINPTTYDMSTPVVNKDNPPSNHPLVTIEKFTYDKPTAFRLFFFNVKYKGNHYIYQDVEFDVLAKYLGDIQDRLYSKDRKHSCLSLSFLIGQREENSKITTAMCVDPCFEKTYNFLHTFVTVSKKGKEYVLDGVFNTIIEKEAYLKMFNAKVISEIDSAEAIAFLKYLDDIDLDIGLPDYLCFPEQVTEGAKKYAKIMQKNTGQ